MANEPNPNPAGQAGSASAGAPLRRKRGLTAVAGLAVLGVGLYFGVAGCSSSSPPPAKPTPTVNPLTGVGAGGRVLAVKVDNVGDAQRQQSGLNRADLVYVIQVEGGLSRYLAVFDSATLPTPARIGPVRSARQTDIPLLAPFGKVGLAYSGAITGLLKDLAGANLQTITPDSAPKQFTNGGSSPTYISPASIFTAFPNLAQAKDVGFRFGALPSGGKAATSVTVSMPSASFTFNASGVRWLVSVDGQSSTTTDAGPTFANNVIIQHVHVVPGKYTDHNAGHPDNEVFSQTTGQGAADFYRAGQVWHGQWSKPTDTSPTSYTVNGVPLQLAPGRTWIVLDGS
jgi:hypothetical protein